MNVSLLLKRSANGVLPAVMMTAGMLLAHYANAQNAVSAPEMLDSYGYTAKKSNSVLENIKSTSCAFTNPTINNSPKKSPLKEAININSTVKAEVIIDENFSKWVDGSESNPSTEMVTDEMAPELMSYSGDWALFYMYEAGGNGYMGFDEIGDDGPGYIMSPGIDLIGNEKEGYFRFTCTVKNANENAQEQSLQAFILDDAHSQQVSASTQPMKYEEWTECQWIGATRTPLTKFMVFGWKGKVFINSFKVEKLIFPLATPVVKEATLNSDGSVDLSWEKVEGATSYTINVDSSLLGKTIATAEVGDETSCNLKFDIFDPSDTYTFFVTAHNGDEISYPGYLVQDLVPEYVGKTVVLPASDITENGFTANWEQAEFASKYLVMPNITHTAVSDGEEFYILNEIFENVPETADVYNPIQIAPLMGMGGMDIYMSRAGWSVDLGVLLRMDPETPALALTNQYASMGIPGTLTSPVTDFSVGGGKVKVTGFGTSSLDDMVLECGLMDANNEIYSSKSIEVTLNGNEFEVELTGGKADSRLVLKITDTVEGGDMVVISNLAVSVYLNEGEKITVPAETVHVDENTTSTYVKCEIDNNNQYSYAVQGYFSANLMGEISDTMEVSNPTAVECVETSSIVKLMGEDLHIVNPKEENCSVYTFDGKLIYKTSAANASFTLEKGSYVVKIGNKTFKVMH